jgi:hypothetical protein
VFVRDLDCKWEALLWEGVLDVDLELWAGVEEAEHTDPATEVFVEEFVALEMLEPEWMGTHGEKIPVGIVGVGSSCSDFWNGP